MESIEDENQSSQYDDDNNDVECHKENENETQQEDGDKLSKEVDTLNISQTSPSSMSKSFIKEDEEEEDFQVTIPFEFQKDECDVWFKTRTGTVGLPSNYVKWISKELQTLVMASDEQQNGEKKEIQLLDFSSESVIQVISFYHPKDFVPLNGKFKIQLSCNQLIFRKSFDEIISAFKSYV